MGEFLIGSVSPWFVSFLFVVVLFVFLSLLPALVRFFVRAPTLFKIVFVATLVLGAAVRFFWVPNQHRIYFDEDRYLTYAVSFAEEGKSLGINLAVPGKVIIGDPDPAARVAVPTLNGWILKLFGYSESNLFIGAKVLSLFQIILIAAGSYLMFKSYFLAAFSSILIAFLPTPVYWSVSTALDSYFVLFSLLAFAAACWYARDIHFRSAALLIAATLILLFVRLESFLFLPVMVLIIYTIRKHENLPLFTKADRIVLASFAPLLAGRILISLSTFAGPWCCGDATPLEAFGLGYFMRNTIPNLQRLFDRPEFPFLISAFAAVSLFGKRDIRILPLGLWLFFYFFIYSFYFAGLFFSYVYSGSYARYFLMVIPPLIVLSGLTIESFLRTFRSSARSKKLAIAALAGFLSLSLISTVKNYKNMVSISPYYSMVEEGPQKIHSFLENVLLAKTPQDAVIIHPLTAVTLLNGRDSVYYGSFLYDQRAIDFVVERLKSGKEVYMSQTYTCDVVPDKCEKILPLFKFTDIKVEENNPYGFVMAKVELKEPAESAEPD